MKTHPVGSGHRRARSAGGTGVVDRARLGWDERNRHHPVGFLTAPVSPIPLPNPPYFNSLRTPRQAIGPRVTRRYLARNVPRACPAWHSHRWRRPPNPQRCRLWTIRDVAWRGVKNKQVSHMRAVATFRRPHVTRQELWSRGLDAIGPGALNH